jgi:hypothetical protein
VHGETILVGKESNGLHGELVGGTEDADGDFTAVGDEDLLEDIIGLACCRPTDGIDRVFVFVIVVHHQIFVCLCNENRRRRRKICIQR